MEKAHFDSFNEYIFNENIQNTYVVNLVGGPCSGKSTVAAEIFSKLKQEGYNAELLSEYIKNQIYMQNTYVSKCQPYIFANELFLLECLCQSVNIVIHDGSFLNNIIYDWRNDETFNKYVLEQYNRFNNIDFFIKRDDDFEFSEAGRIHTLEESKKLDEKIFNIYKENNRKLYVIPIKNAANNIINILKLNCNI